LPPLPFATLAPITPTEEMQVVVVVPGPTGTPAPVATPAVLLLGEHMSATGSITQTETEAAGPMLCQVQRGSCAFSHLVADYDPDLLFSGSEPPPYNDEDRLMHPDAILPLANLAVAVHAEWGPAVQVM